MQNREAKILVSDLRGETFVSFSNGDLRQGEGPRAGREEGTK